MLVFQACLAPGVSCLQFATDPRRHMIAMMTHADLKHCNCSVGFCLVSKIWQPCQNHQPSKRCPGCARHKPDISHAYRRFHCCCVLQHRPDNVQVQVVVVSDEIASISSEVRAASDAYEIVITAGGVGPTLDDVTLAGIAGALGKPLVRYDHRSRM